MRKILANVCIALLLISVPIQSSQYATNVYVDGKGINAGAFIDNNRTYIPIRVVGQELGCKIEWKGETSSIYIYKNFATIELRIGSNIGVLMGRVFMLENPPIIKEGVSYIPLREIMELFGVDVHYDKNTNGVYIIHTKEN